jgi:hypothetical protein
VCDARLHRGFASAQVGHVNLVLSSPASLLARLGFPVDRLLNKGSADNQRRLALHVQGAAGSSVDDVVEVAVGKHCDLQLWHVVRQSGTGSFRTRGMYFH